MYFLACCKVQFSTHSSMSLYILLFCQHWVCCCKAVYRLTIIIIIIIIIISFMQGIYTYNPETSYVPREYSVAAILLLVFTVLISLVSVLDLLYFYTSTFRSMCAVPNMAVFWSSLTSCFPRMLLTYFLNDFENIPRHLYYTGQHTKCIRNQNI